MTVIPIHADSSVQVDDITTALDAEIDTVWALIASLQTILTEHDGDPYIKGALRLANGLLDELSAIRRDCNRL